MKLIVANWKMNKTAKDAEQFCNIIKNIKTESEIIVLPSFTALPVVSNILGREKVGAQDIYEEEKGSFTGSVSAEMVKEMADYVLIGHSDRRGFESNEVLNKKIKLALNAGLKVIYCVGDKKEEDREAVIKQQLKEGFDGIGSGSVIVAYEPIWAISSSRSGELPKKEKVKEAIDMIKEIHNGKVLYGGSVDGDNAEEYLSVSDGILVGSASLDVNSFIKVIKS
jgi:triosephosphate isomerase (TIM)